MKNIYLAFLHKIGFSQKQLHFIFKSLDNYEEFFNNLQNIDLRRYLRSEKQIENLKKNLKKLDKQKIESLLDSREVTIVSIKDEEYPALLKEIPNPPFVLYIRGNLDDSPKISIVGSRSITTYGERVIKNIISDLSKYFIIVSGGAFGCDSIAHIETINSFGKTISVIGTGIDIDYPSSNKNLYEKVISSGGAVISIFPVGEAGNPYNFPIRNEIIAGLSNGTIIIEAKEKSGSLITAKLALDLGRDLFAVPGDIFRINSIGCNNLILNGEAKIVTKSEDILSEYNVNQNVENKDKSIIFDDLEEEKIYKTIITDNLTINEITKKTGFEVQFISLKLSMMEIKGYVSKSEGGKYYVI